MLAQTAIAFWRSTGSVNTLVMIESVAGKIERRADAGERPHGDQHAGRVGQRRRRAADAEDDQADGEHAPSAEPVAEAAAR